MPNLRPSKHVLVSEHVFVPYSHTSGGEVFPGNENLFVSQGEEATKLANPVARDNKNVSFSRRTSLGLRGGYGKRESEMKP